MGHGAAYCWTWIVLVWVKEEYVFFLLRVTVCLAYVMKNKRLPFWKLYFFWCFSRDQQFFLGNMLHEINMYPIQMGVNRCQHVNSAVVSTAKMASECRLQTNCQLPLKEVNRQT